MRTGSYKTVCKSSLESLDFAVNDMLGQDWELYGSPYVVQPCENLEAPVAPKFCQAMVQYSEEVSPGNLP
ncbi:MAG: hypothetical protein WCT12_13540 [Verrucomicrobiota bacterium]|jgi:hypothetical protein